jgi:TolA-binding protein
VLYNGNLALKAGLKEIEESYKDNYWKILPVERLSISDEFSTEREKQNPNFDRAEEKAVKAVQTHGMNIKGKEKNSQIDEAYILLGQTRYFSGRFIPALEAFNYILFKYPASDNVNLAKIWRAKTNLRLQNEVIAIENFKDII